jgi:methylmalonyl-CoA mutase cobalamin-binding subunit
LRLAVGILRSEGIEAHAEIAHPDPYTAAVHAVRDERVDEIIVSTFHGAKQSKWLRGHVVERLRKDTKLPVEHVEVAPAPAPEEVTA